MRTIASTLVLGMGVANLVCISRRTDVCDDVRIRIDDVADDAAPTASDRGFWWLV